MTEEVTAITQIELVKDGSTYSLVFTGRNKHGDILVTSIVPGSIDRFKADHQLPKKIDEECVGCAGPCKVVDVAAKLQEELDEAHGILASKDRVLVNLHKTIHDFKAIETLETDRLHKIIEELKDKNIEDLHELYDLYEKELRGIKADRTSIKSDRDIMFQNYRNTIAKLQGDISGLEVEISICKEDSAVLTKVVEVMKDDTISRFAVPWRIRCIVGDYLDAPEGPPDPFIDNSCIGCERLDALNECKEQIHTQKLTIESLLKETPQVADLKQSLEAASVVLTKTENELSVCKEDSVVLTKVVEIIKNWDDSTGRAFPTLIKILDELVDYTDAPEVPEETPIDDLYRVSVFLEMP